MIYMHGMYCSCKDKIFVMFNLFCECFFSTVKKYRFRMFSYYSCIMVVCVIYIIMCSALFMDAQPVFRTALSFCDDMIGGLWLRMVFFADALRGIRKFSRLRLRLMLLGGKCFSP